MLNLGQLGRFRVHIVLGALTVFWFSLSTILGVLDGDSVLHAFWTSIKEVKLMEWVTVICVWFTFASLVKENYELRAKLEASRH